MTTAAAPASAAAPDVSDGTREEGDTDGAGGSGGSEVVVVLMSAPDAGTARRIVGALLDERLVACGNIVPGATSLYRWEGQVRQDEEAVAILKTLRRLVPRVLERAAALHPYDVPELLVQRVADGAGEYLDWVRRECASGGRRTS